MVLSRRRRRGLMTMMISDRVPIPVISWRGSPSPGSNLKVLLGEFEHVIPIGWGAVNPVPGVVGQRWV